jgi:hypothetical protein
VALQLGPVSQHLARWIAGRAKADGIIVWLDADGHYTRFVDHLALAHRDRDFDVPVVPFRGSFLEQMLLLRDHTSGLGRAPVVVHMPGFTEDSIRHTPTLEVYRAGLRERKALDTLVREAASGQVTPGQIDAFLAEPGLTLERADAWLRGAAARSSSELSAWLEHSDPHVVLDALLLPDTPRGARLHASDVAPILVDWFERKLGVDAAWRAFVNPIVAGGATPEFPALTHALCVEYVFDLRRPPRLPALLPLTRLDASLRAANQALAAWFRSNHPARYEVLANDLEARLQTERDALRGTDLGKIDTFRFEEEQLMGDALEALDDERFDVALEWAGAREQNTSFWASLSPWRLRAWELIAAGARLGQALTRATAAATAWPSHEHALEAYTRRDDGAGWRVDHAHRALETLRANRFDARVPNYPRLQHSLNELRRSYRVWADTLALAYADTCAHAGFLPPAALRQTTIFHDVVRPLLDANDKHRVAYVLVDALRFEMAQALYAAMHDARGVVATLRARFAECPTETWLGMNALALDHRGDGPIHVKFGESVRAGAFTIKDPETRRRAMGDAAGLKSVVGLTLDETLALPEDVLEHKIRQTRLVVVHSTAIDAAGEHGQGLSVFDAELSKLRSGFERLRAAGVQHFVFTADHGFLLHDAANLRRIPYGSRKDPGRRNALHPAPASEPGLVRVVPSHLGLAGVDGVLVFPASTHVFDRGNQADDFVHGGLTLQERVIPVLQVTHKNPKGRASLTYTLTLEHLPPVGTQSRVRGSLGIAATGQLAYGGDEALDLSVRVPGRADVTVDIIACEGGTVNGTSVRVTAGRRFTLTFHLFGPQEEAARIELVDLASTRRLPPTPLDVWLPVLQRRRTVDVAKEPESAPAPAPAPADPASWLVAFEDRGVRQVFAHLAKHGSITEAEATAALGSPRQFRAFSRDVDKWAAHAPFAVRVESTATGKRYVREGAL